MKKYSEKFFVNVLSNIVICALVFVVFSVSFGGSIISAFNPPSQSAIYRGNTSKKYVSLMFNVYGGTEYIEGMLKVLNDNNVKATFFIGGCWADKNTGTLQKIEESGMEIGNHGFLHKDHKQLSYARNQEEILVCEKVVQTVCGVKTSLFAPPSGSYSNTVLKAASDLGYKTVMWSKDTIDWRDKDSNLIYSRATKNAKNGDLILMHPTECTLNALGGIVKFYIEGGFLLVTVSENLL